MKNAWWGIGKVYQTECNHKKERLNELTKGNVYIVRRGVVIYAVGELEINKCYDKACDTWQLIGMYQ